MLREEEMPPEDEPPLAAPDRSRLIGWIAHTLDNVDVERIPRDPGSVSPRRLNRTEYDYTLRDIFGIDTHSARLLPADQVFGDGFDNEAVALTVEELWLEKALAAADETVLAVWKDPEALSKLLFVRPSPPPEKAVYVSSPAEARLCDMSRDFTVVARFKGTTPSTILLKSLPGKGFEEGTRQLRFSHFSLVYSIGPKREFRASGVDVADGREHVAALKLEAGRATWLLDGQVVDRIGDFNAPDHDEHVLKVGWVPAFSRRKLLQFAELSFFARALPDEHLIAMTAGEQVSKPPESVFHWRPGVERKDGFVSAEAAAERVLLRYLRRAFRRPLTAEEMTRYMGLYRQATKAGLPFDQGRATRPIDTSPEII